MEPEGQHSATESVTHVDKPQIIEEMLSQRQQTLPQRREELAFV